MTDHADQREAAEAPLPAPVAAVIDAARTAKRWGERANKTNRAADATLFHRALAQLFLAVEKLPEESGGPGRTE